ncbi:DUF1800 domain-containing protein [Granulicella sibirica]|uniref:Putative SIGNAL PEPTIDE PROTEIN n=1 Tax=Granulicella sibirica TaxID=2479048 RepID=A0A4Q0SY19_9BACT|nr:DUF1800 domain-containing protein [Granulicella sibirica]RXH56093.1 putative SIGNAL PEPTIDE PROTEIN [Granulicella sibirica]
MRFLLDGIVVGAVCSMLVVQPVLAAGAVPMPAKGKATEIQGDERVLHALNRFTFGPRPGDVAAVRSMGLERWFERQLDPASIDDSALDARLAAFSAMRLDQVDLMHRFPNPAVIRVMARQGDPLPMDPVERAIYGDQIEFYKMKVAAKSNADSAGKKMATDDSMEAQANAASQAKAENEGADPLAVAPEQHVGALYAQDATDKMMDMPPDVRFQAILRMQPKELAGFRRSLSKRELLQVVSGMTPEQKEILLALGGSNRVIAPELTQSRLVRDIYSDRQLEAVMTDFWLNHFNVYVKKSQLEPDLIPAYEREVIRPNALGRFEDLLVATAKSPAMLVYLDNWRSAGPDSAQARRRAKFGDASKNGAEGLNENYARELMELHTLGVGGGYTQADVTQVAKVFTGWGIEKPYLGATYSFQANRHQPGDKTVMGKTIRGGGEEEGLQVLHMLATSPATAKFISTKLAVRFVSDDPPPALVDRMSKAFLSSGGDMKVVLRTMFRSPEFWSPEVDRAKVKTPLEFVVSAVRASGAEVKNAQPLVQALDKLGMPLYGMQTPNGYDWKKEPWVSTGALVSRMNFALVLSANKVNGVRTDWVAMLGSGGLAVPVSVSSETAEAVKERKLEDMLLGEPVGERTRAAVLAQFDDASMKENAAKEFDLRGDEVGGGRRVQAQGDAQAAGMAGLLLGSPEFQRR